jgi:photosystem II stability/assembly factor-like uncharacterized protein
MIAAIRTALVFVSAVVALGGCADGDKPAPATRFWVATGGSRGCRAEDAASLIARSDDGGLTWAVVGSPGDPGPGASPVRSLRFFDHSRGFAATTEHLWRTDDGGDSWSDVTAALISPRTESIQVSDLASAGHEQALVVGSETIRSADGRRTAVPFVARTADGGDSWIRGEVPQLATPRSDSLAAVCLSPSGLGLAVGSNLCHTRGCRSQPEGAGDLALVTRDGGTTWRDITERIGGAISGSAYCSGSDHLWADGAYLFGFAHSPDGGETWNDQLLPVIDGWQFPVRQRLSFPDPFHGWFTAPAFDRAQQRLFATSTSGASWLARPLPPLAGDEVLDAILFVTSDLGLAIGHSCEAPPVGFPTGNGGRTWQRGAFPEETSGIGFEVIAGIAG